MAAAVVAERYIVGPKVDLPLPYQEDPEFITCQVFLELVKIDEDGQRPREPKHRDEIAGNWQDSKAKHLQVSFNEDCTWYRIVIDLETGDRLLETDGTLHIWDGAHTYEGALIVGLETLPAQLYPAMTKEQAYRRFTDQYLLAQKIKLDQTVRVLINAGDDDMLFIKSVMKRLNWDYDKISALQTVINVALRDAPSRDHFYNVGRLLNAVFPDQPARWTEPALQAASNFLIKWQDHPNYDQKRLVEKFKGTDLSMLLNGHKQTRKNKPRNDRDSATIHGMLLYTLEDTYDADRKIDSKRLKPLNV